MVHGLSLRRAGAIALLALALAPGTTLAQRPPAKPVPAKPAAPTGPPGAPKAPLPPDIDYTLVKRTNPDGQTYSYIRRDGIDMLVLQPADWNMVGGGSLSLTSPKFPGTLITLRKSSVKVDATTKFDADWLTSTRLLIPRLAPAGSKAIKIDREGPTAAGAGRAAYEFSLRYEFSGQIYATQITFVYGLARSLQELIVTAREVDAKEAQRIGKSVVSSLREQPIGKQQEARE